MECYVGLDVSLKLTSICVVSGTGSVVREGVICIDARHAKAVLKMQINKSDRNDAAGIARIMQTGWFKEVRVKDLDNHAVKALLASRALLVKIKRDLENQIRGLLKNVGLVIGRAKFNVFAMRAEELIAERRELIAVVGPLLKARNAIEQQTDDLDRTMTVVRSPDFLRALNQRDCVCTIDPPATSYAIMRRAGPYRGENTGPGKDDREELGTEARN